MCCLLLQWRRWIGMLQLVEHKIVHRDLALRNLLAFTFDSEDPNKVTIKLTDYGLSSTGTYVPKTTSSVGDWLPFRWMAPEAIERLRANASQSCHSASSSSAGTGANDMEGQQRQLCRAWPRTATVVPSISGV